MLWRAAEQEEVTELEQNRGALRFWSNGRRAAGRETRRPVQPAALAQTVPGLRHRHCRREVSDAANGPAATDHASTGSHASSVFDHPA